MSDSYLLAIDAGTGSVRAVLFSENGEQLGCVQREWTHREDPRYPGSMDFDWIKNWELASGCVRGVLSETGIDPRRIAAISTTCMREGIVLYDREGTEIWACANVDARSNDEVAQLKAMDPALERELYALSGQTYALGALPRILWVKNKLPAIYEKTAYVSMFNDWLIYKMTGTLASEPSNGCTTGIFDIAKRAWEPSIADRVGIRSDIFPPVKECGTKAGTTNARCARETGLAEGTPVITGGGDAQMGCVGVGVVEANQAAVFGGSFWQYEYNIDEPSTERQCRVRVNCHGVPGLWQYEALAFKPGLVMRWFRDAFCGHEIERAAAQGLSPYELLDAEAEKIPVGSNGMMCAFSDVMDYISWRHASPTFTDFDFDPAKFSKYTFYRAIMENTALVTMGHLDLVREATGKAPKEVVFAGGAARSATWTQILSDALGMPVRVPVVKEATALGTAILAGYGIGLYGNIADTARKLVKIERTYEPNAERHAIYREMYARWRQIYQNQLDLSDRRVTRHLWAAPGL